jgi:hypothetical protein
VGSAHGGDYGEIPGAHALLAPDPVPGAPGHHQHSHRLRGAGKSRPRPAPRSRRPAPCMYHAAGSASASGAGRRGWRQRRVTCSSLPGILVCSQARMTLPAPSIPNIQKTFPALDVQQMTKDGCHGTSPIQGFFMHERSIM